MSKSNFLLTLIALMIFSMLVCASPGAKFGKLKGHANNAANGAPLRNLTIEVIGQAETTTDENGAYHFDHLPVGSYSLIIKSSQFDKHERTVTINANQTTISNFRAIPLAAPRP